MVKDLAVAEDVVQDAFVSYLKNKDTISPEEQAIKSYLYSSVRNAIYNLHRKSKTVQKFWQRNPFEESIDNDFEHAIIRSEYMAMIFMALEQLPPSCRQIIKMSYLEGMSNHEIAQELDISVNTIKTQKLRGIRALKTFLNPELLGILFFLLKK